VFSATRVHANVRVFISYAHDNLEHEHKVQSLCNALRKQGIDARIDLPAAAERQDWPLWMLDQFLAADYVLVIASPEYKRRAEGRARSDEGRGVQWETALIRNDLYGNPRTAIHRYLPVVLPGCLVSDIPIWMQPNSATVYTISGYTTNGTIELTRVLTSRLHKKTLPLEPLSVLPSQLEAPSQTTINKLRREVLGRLVDRSEKRDVPMIYADVQQFLLIGGIGVTPIDLCADSIDRDSMHARLDVEPAHTAIEVSRDLRSPSTFSTVRNRLFFYLKKRTLQTSERYVGIATDGTEWHAYLVVDDNLVCVASITCASSEASVYRLLTWLESILATGIRIEPTPREIVARLGVDSPGHLLDEAELRSLYSAHRNLPNVRVRRYMWARLLTTASGTNFTDEDTLFVNHTLLVAMAKIIGHAVINRYPESQDIDAGSLMSGATFYRAQITGVVEADFFDWIVDVAGGSAFIESLARRLMRFDWREVQHDVLKLLYESIIPAKTRKQLGEHYTPDWLAEEIVAESISDPLKQRVLDASCGSGTFLFYAVRRYLDAADKEEYSDIEAIRGVVRHVFGVDVHPVAVTLARVTYLLAIGKKRLSSNRHPPFAVPVFLGDSLKWGRNQALWSYEGLSIPTGDDYEMFINDPGKITGSEFDDYLKFPDRVVADTEHFDQLVTDLAVKASSRDRGDPRPKLTSTFAKFSIAKEDQAIIQRTFKNMCDLHDNEKDHIWGYYVRNLARPSWLAQPANRLDVLVGNPPWLSYRHMTERQQAAFRDMVKERWLREGIKFAPTQDLSALFVARCIEQYLKPGGRFGFVMPGAVLKLDNYKGFRTGVYGGKIEPVWVRFKRPWDLYKIKPKFFSQHVSVVHGKRASVGESAKPLSEVPEVWSGRFSTTTALKSEAREHITRTIAELPPILVASGSPYRSRVFQGATFVPQFVFTVELEDIGFLSAGVGRTAVQSRRTANEHPPWADIEDMHEVIENEFLRPVYLGESLVPFKVLAPELAIVPWDGTRLLRGREEDLFPYPGLQDWWHHAEGLWNEYRSNDRLGFRSRLDHHRALSKQLPAAELRVVYNKSGKFLASAVVRDSRAVIAQQLYWCAVSSIEEARFLTAILNSTTVTLAVQPLQSHGENSFRDFARLPFRLTIPLYDPGDDEHEKLVSLAERAERVVEAHDLPTQLDFKAMRSQVRDLLVEEGVIAEIDALVKKLIA